MNCSTAAERFSTMRPCELHLLRQLRQRGLHPIVDVDRIGIGVGPRQEADGQVVAAVIAARRLHVDHLVDADDLRFERLGDGGFDDGGRGAGICGADLNVRRHDIRELRHGNAGERDRTGDGDDDGDDDGEPRAADEDGGDHRDALRLRSATATRWRPGSAQRRSRRWARLRPGRARPSGPAECAGCRRGRRSRPR